MATIQEFIDGASIVQIVDLYSSGGAYSHQTVDSLENVDLVTEGKKDGSVLVYDAGTEKWVSSLVLQEQVMNGGTF